MKPQTAKLTKLTESLNRTHRKEAHGLDKCYALISGKTTAAELRLYSAGTKVYACLWIHAGENYGSGSGWAGGYGYHKQSSAAGSAFRSAGVNLSQSIDGVGDSAIREAMLALGKALKVRNAWIFETHP